LDLILSTKTEEGRQGERAGGREKFLIIFFNLCWSKGNKMYNGLKISLKICYRYEKQGQTISFLVKKLTSWAWWYTSVIPELESWKQEDCKFKANVGHIVRARPVWDAWQNFDS
jgi:hypothetical protein